MASKLQKMLILDSSAVVAVMLAEPGYERILERIGSAERVGIGAPTTVETAMVLSARWRQDARRQLLDFLREAEAEIVPFGIEHFEAAVDAFLRYGKGRHAAALNFGDCLAYATAEVAGLPLLFIGDDLAKTGIGAA